MLKIIVNICCDIMLAFATCNLQLATRNLQVATRNWQLATRTLPCPCWLRCDNSWSLLPILSKYTSKSGPPPARQRTAIWMAFRWRAAWGRHCVLLGCVSRCVLNAVLRIHICAGSSEPLSHVISIQIA